MSLKKYKFKTTLEFLDWVATNLATSSKTASKTVGDCWEEFATEWHLQSGEYINVYDANKPELIPQTIINRIDGQRLLEKTATHL